MSTTTGQLVKDRIDNLWNLVISFTSSPNYTKYLCKMIFRLAQDNDIKLQNSFFQMVCPCCFLFFMPSVNCQQKFYTNKRLRRFKGKKGKLEKNIKAVIRSSQLTTGKVCKKSDSIMSTFKCKDCKTLLINDLSPLEFVEHKPAAAIKPNQPSSTGPKKETLQKALQKSQIPKNSEPVKKEMDLESFLQGFL